MKTERIKSGTKKKCQLSKLAEVRMEMNRRATWGSGSLLEKNPQADPPFGACSARGAVRDTNQGSWCDPTRYRIHSTDGGRGCGPGQALLFLKSQRICPHVPSQRWSWMMRQTQQCSCTEGRDMLHKAVFYKITHHRPGHHTEEAIQ